MSDVARPLGFPGFVQPAEWLTHDACWLAWPSHEDLWQEQLAPARDAFVALCEGIHDHGKGEALDILVLDEKQEQLAREALAGLGARFHRIAYGDIWLRDTAPIVVRDASGHLAAYCFQFNGWGEKYVLEHDADVAREVARATGLPVTHVPWVLEGGSVESDGEGTILTTRQCLLNPNRNRAWGGDQAVAEAHLRDCLGGAKVLWLDEGLRNDHTDGHIDTLVRFVGPAKVVCMEPRSSEDPNRDALLAILDALDKMRDALGRPLDVVRIPSPGLVTDGEGEVMPASFVNFYIANTAVIVPTYGTPWDEQAVALVGALFPERRTVGVHAKAILSGGGAFHCITQQQPRSVGAP